MNSIGAGQFASHLGGYGVAARFQQREAVAESNDYHQFIDLLYQDLDDIFNKMQSSPKRRAQRDEDGITDEIVIVLSSIGYDADHDKDLGGHVDVTVELGAHSWIGEAKKDSKFNEGFLQLTTRYRHPSGNFEHSHGGMLLYFADQTANIQTLTKRWRAKFEDKEFRAMFCEEENIDKVVIENCQKRPQTAFYTKHIHNVTGNEFVVRHMSMALMFHPQDISGRQTAARKAAKAEKAAISPAVKVSAKRVRSKPAKEPK